MKILYNSAQKTMLTPAIEFLVLFLFLPLAYRFSPVFLSPLPILWAVALYSYFQLRKEKGYSFSKTWNSASISSQLPSVLLPFLCFVFITASVVWKVMPQDLFGLARNKTWLWALIVLLYPILSVFPQSLIYRAFLMERYKKLFPSSTTLIVVSALAFSFMHIIFRNPIAVILTFLGGLLFAWRYHRTGSLAVSTLEHALYGCALFTIGLGEYFYHGRIRL